MAGPADDPAAKDACLELLDAKGKVKETVVVQFNPASLRLTMSNSVDGGVSRGRQAQQFVGRSSTTLHVELEFDTADEGTTAEPVDVRTRTGQVARFVLPGEGSKQAPPRVQFRWSTLAVRGVMTSLTEELDLFAPGGVPLRAKLSVEIKEQDPTFEALESGPGKNPDTGAAPAGEGVAEGNGPGTAPAQPTGADARTAEALDGESAADFLARNDQPPQAWRAVAGLVGDALALAAGTSIDFSSSLSLGAGIGISAGFEAGLDVSIGATLGAAVSAAAGSPGGANATTGTAEGFALAAAGGVSAAIQQQAIEETTTAAAASLSAFGLPAAPAAGGGTVSSGRPSGAASPASALAAGVAAPRPLPRPAPPQADPRAVSYGRGVPLRQRILADESLAATGTGIVVVAPYRTPAAVQPDGGTATGRRCCG